MSVPGSVVIEGIILGLNYGLLALGLVLIYRTSRVLNFAQGQLGVVAAVLLVKLHDDYGIWYWAALVAALAVAAGAGAISELVLRRLFDRPRVMVMIATVGLSQVLYLFTVLPFVRPKKLFRAFPVPIHLTFHVSGYQFQPGDVLTLIVAPAVAVALAVFIRRSHWGLTMRAMAENTESARLSGVWVRRTSTVAWTIAGVLSAITAILASPSQTSALTQVLSPDLLLRALTAALIGAMISLPVAMIAGVAIGVVQEVLLWNVTSQATVQLILFVLLLAVLLVRVGALQKGMRTTERASWSTSASSGRRGRDALRDRVGRSGVILSLVVVVLLPFVVSTGRSFLLSQVCIFAVIALSLTVLTGWAGQVSLGQFGLVAVGADVAAHFGKSVPLVLLLPLGGVITAAVAVIVGLPALRVRGLYLAVSTLGFALFIQDAALATRCWRIPLVNRRVCAGLPDPQSTLIARPTLFGIHLTSERSFAWFSIGVLVLTVVMVRIWRDRGVARRLIAVRDNESGAAATGIPVVRTKLLAFTLSGFMAGYAGVCFAFATERFGATTFAPALSILAVSMVVIGGLDSIVGALLGALYLVGLPAVFGTTPTIQILTSGLGLMAFILYLPGGMAELLHRAGDLVAAGIARLGPHPPDRGPPELSPEELVAETTV
jgi:ABC-type branched-subunit amino acid transport system permease subunit